MLCSCVNINTHRLQECKHTLASAARAKASRPPPLACELACPEEYTVAPLFCASPCFNMELEMDDDNLDMSGDDSRAAYVTEGVYVCFVFKRM